MRRSSERKLQLRKETLRELESANLQQVAGAFSRLGNCETRPSDCGTVGWTGNDCPSGPSICV